MSIACAASRGRRWPARPTRRGCGDRARSRSARTATNPVDAARSNDRHFAFEIDERFENRFWRPSVSQALSGSSSRDRDLALAVVAERRRLEHGRPADLRTASARSTSLRTLQTVSPAGRVRRNVFSRIRCCAISSARPFGPHDRVRFGRRRRPPPTRSQTQTSRRRRPAQTPGCVDIVVRARRPRRRRFARSAYRVRERACGRDSPFVARPWRTCGRAGRRRGRQSSSRAGSARDVTKADRARTASAISRR